jgi:hypothetical protein
VLKVKPALDYSKHREADLLVQMEAIYDGMKDNPAFPNPPVDMATFKAAIDSYRALMTEALDGGRKAVSAKRKQREVVVKIAKQLGHYVEAASDNDLATFNTSRFVAISKTRTPPQPLPPSGIKWVDRGPTSGSIQVRVTTLPKAGAYELRYAVVGADGLPGEWTMLTFLSSKTLTINGLTSGANYAFQARALGWFGFTDWSDSTTFFCG